MSSPNSSDVFISYSRRDEQASDRLYKALAAQGLTVVQDKFDIVPGEPLKESIGQLIDTSQNIVCLISKNSLSSIWVLWELSRSLDHAGLDTNKARLLPAFLDNTFQQDIEIESIQNQVEVEISTVGKHIELALERGARDDHLSARRNSLIGFKNELPPIVEFLRATLITDLRVANFANGVLDLHRQITGKPELPMPNFDCQSLDNTSYSHRRQLVVDLVAQDKLHEGAKHALSVAKEFIDSDVALHDRANVLCGQIKAWENVYEETKNQVTAVERMEVASHYISRRAEYAREICELLPSELSYAA